MKITINDTPSIVELSTLSKGEIFHVAGYPHDPCMVINQTDSYLSRDVKDNYSKQGLVICVNLADGELMTHKEDEQVLRLYNMTADYNPS